MKGYWIFLVLIATAGISQVLAEPKLSEDCLKNIAEKRETCMKESKVTPERLENARKGDYSNDPSFKKHVYCVSKGLKLQHDNGTISTEFAKTAIMQIFKDVAVVTQLIHTCFVQYNNEPSQVAVDMFKCLYVEKQLNLL